MTRKEREQRNTVRHDHNARMRCRICGKKSTHIHEDVIGEPSDRVHVVDRFDLMVASWHIAALVYGPDDGSMERDDIECRMENVMRRVFDGVHHFGSLGDVGTTEDRIERAREFLRREFLRREVDARRDAEGAAGRP